MRYATNSPNVTPLDMLPELEDVERGGSTFAPTTSILPPEQSDKFRKYIRQNHVVSNHAGMNQSHQPNYSVAQAPRQEQYGTPVGQQESLKTFNMPPGSPSCLDVAEHITNCPICSKFYNTDKTIYIIAIIALAIICILLLKKVLDV
uniref:Uncharacterized protein n=1 Tax=viral metagenome TaxID=1070528 RepID=A0A6C0H384_9ZZZZ